MVPIGASRRRLAGAPALVLSAVLLGGCASGGATGPATSPTVPEPIATPTAAPPESKDEVTRALLLLLADRRLFEPVTMEQAFAGGPDLRVELATALGRIGDPRGRVYLEQMLASPEPAVRRAAVFALGELGRRESARTLLVAARDRDRETGVLAVEALGKLGVSVVEMGDALEPLGEQEAWARLLPHLFRFDEEAAVPLAIDGLGTTDPALHARAAYALGRHPRPEGAAALRGLLADSDPFVRGWAARGLGEVGGAADLARLAPLLSDPEPEPTIEALRSGRRLVLAGTTAAPEGWRPRLLELVADPRPQVRLTAVETASAWLLDDELGAALAGLAAAPDPPALAGAALVSLAQGADPRAGDLAAAAAVSTVRDLRARAAEAAGWLTVAAPDLAAAEAAWALVERLLADPDPKVRGAALQAAIDHDPAGAAARVTDVLERDTDPGMRAAALGWTADHPEVPLDVLAQATAYAMVDRNVESSLEAVAALAARAEAEPLERGALVAVLERLAETAAERPVRLEAAAALEELDRPAPAVGAVETEREVEVYRDVLRRTARPRTVALATSAGTLTLRLDCPRAPMTCLNFLQLAAQGFYDGLIFHRVVPDFVVQAGDPRGDGWGGPGYTVRDEINRLRYDRGVVGMALAGADTGGSQFFISLSPQPHLDGGYTAFGRVTAGEEVLDAILPGTRIVSVTEVE